MEAVIFVGLQGAGKSSFFQERFAATHVRVNLDTVKTRARERALVESCIANRQSFVVDNTNPTAAERAHYIQPAKAAGYTIIGYYFDVDVKVCLARNAQRTGKARIHPAGIYGARKRMQPPTLEEGFDAIYIVRLTSAGSFEVSHQSS